MDVLRIIQKDGYKAEDLNAGHQETLRWLRFLEGDFAECFEYNGGMDYGIIGDLKSEIAQDVIEQVKHWLEIQIAMYQINFAEEEGCAR